MYSARNRYLIISLEMANPRNIHEHQNEICLILEQHFKSCQLLDLEQVIHITILSISISGTLCFLIKN